MSSIEPFDLYIDGNTNQMQYAWQAGVRCSFTRPKSQIRNPKSRFVVVSVGQKAIKQGYANQRRHYDNVSDALRVQHVIMQCVYRAFHILIPEIC